LAITARDATRKDLDHIVSVHLAAFRGFLMSLLGPGFLKVYYSLVMEYDSGIAVVCDDGAGQVCGFAVGFVHPEKFYKYMKRNQIRLALPAIKYVIGRPSIVFRVFLNMRRIHKISEKKVQGLVQCELSSIAVNPAFRRKGLGKYLVSAFLERARVLGADMVYLTTDAFGNESANLFYRSLGFTIGRRFEASPGRVMNEYVMCLTDRVCRREEVKEIV